ncbi:MAG: DUF4118 domain-containing protein [Gammaproteobacteria bacterium]|nr:DUF4118 domain-containing protein [Gammaproteobacteria bacterium]
MLSERFPWGVERARRPWLLVVLCLAVAVALAYLIEGWLPHANHSLIFLVAVLAVAGNTGFAPAVATAVLAFVAYNFLFTAPAHTLRVHSTDELATLGFFLIAGLLVAALGARMRRYVTVAAEHAARAEDLGALSRRLAAVSDADAVATALVEGVAAVTGHRAEVSYGGASSAAVPRGWSELALATDAERFGQVRVDSGDPAVLETVRGLCAQAAVVLERIRLAAALDEARIETETERLRGALLSSVSHDLRTPLASIIGATTSLRELGPALSTSAREDLLDMVVSEAERLNRYIQNLLDMTRLGQGALSLKRDWTDVDDIVASALARLGGVLRGVDVALDLASGLPLLRIHGALVEQALVNVLENAARHSPPGGTVTLAVAVVDGELRFEVSDAGPGIPPAERERVFESFYTAQRGDSGAEGTGLGLAIARGFVGAHGGSIVALDGPGGVGSTFRISLPLPEEAPDLRDGTD